MADAVIKSILDEGTSSFQALRTNLEKASTGDGAKLAKNVLVADHVRYSGFTPYTSGRGFFIPLKMPKFMTIKAGTDTDIFKILMMYYVKSITGFSDRTLEFTDVDTGVDQNNVAVATSTSGATKELTFEFLPDLQGLFISKYIRIWADGIVDPGTHDGSYYGAKDGEDLLEYDHANHTLEGIYFVTDPSRTKIQGTALILGAMPSTIPKAYLDSTNGQHDFYIPQITFKCQVWEDLKDVMTILTNIGVIDMIAGTQIKDVRIAKEAGDDASVSLPYDATADISV